MNSEKYIGLDVHQATISVAVLGYQPPHNYSGDNSSDGELQDILCHVYFSNRKW